MPARWLRLQQSCVQGTHHSVSRALVPGSSPITPAGFKQSCQASTAAQPRKQRDQYVIAQTKARKAANISRQEVLRKERAVALGDPVRGATTPLLQSFDTARPPPSANIDESSISEQGQQQSLQNGDGSLRGHEGEGSTVRENYDDDRHLNFFLSQDELSDALRRSDFLTRIDPQPELIENASREKQLTPEELLALREESRANAEEAIRRITGLELGTGKDRMRVNKQRCIDIFGRHHTDMHLPARQLQTASTSASGETADAPLKGLPRVGPDTGSSEVQIAILTAKIKSLADFLDTRGGKDKMNKRNLRLLVHRRAKLLKYLRRKERGGPRWQHLVESLGLTDGTWKGEISL